MPIRRSLAVLFLAGLTALAACSSDGSDAPEENPAGDADSDQLEEQLQAPEPDIDDVPDVVAEVNGEEIDREEFITAYEGQLQQAFMMQQGEDVDQAELKQQVAQQLVNNHLLVQTAEAAGISATDDDVASELEELAQANGLESTDELLEALEAQGMTEDQVRQDIANQYQIDTYLEDKIDISEPTEEELQEQYDDIVEQLQAEGQAGDEELPSFDEVRDMLVDDAKREQESEAIDSLLKELQGDADITIHL